MSFKMKKNINKITNEVKADNANKVDKTGGRINRRTTGIYDDGCILNINNTPTARKADVLGFTTPDQIATYKDRDAVGLYLRVDSYEPLTATATAFTVTTMTLSSMPEGVEVGMLVDIMGADALESNKYSGQITSIDGNVITSSGWFKFGDTSAGQVPVVADYSAVRINPLTKLWCENINGFLWHSLCTKGVIGEYGLFNYIGEAGSMDGFDLISIYGKNTFGYKARTKPENLEKLENGFYDVESVHSFVSENPSGEGFTVDGFNNKKGFVGKDRGTGDIADRSTATTYLETLANGKIEVISPNAHVLSTDTAISNSPSYFYLVTTGCATITLPKVSDSVGKMFKLILVNTNSVTINKFPGDTPDINIQNRNVTAGYNLVATTTISKKLHEYTFFNNGDAWRIIGDFDTMTKKTPSMISGFSLLANNSYQHGNLVSLNYLISGTLPANTNTKVATGLPVPKEETNFACAIINTATAPAVDCVGGWGLVAANGDLYIKNGSATAMTYGCTVSVTYTI